MQAEIDNSKTLTE